jgi:lysine 2,3-aminomutase
MQSSHSFNETPRNSPWAEVAPEDWNNWKWQLKNRITKLEQLESLIELTSEERKGCLFADKKLALAITPYFFNLINRKDTLDPIRLQVVPKVQETTTAPEELLDPVGEDDTSPVEGIVHRYPDRVLFLVTDRCASYCRYCTRSRLVSNAQDYNFHPKFDIGLEYIRNNPQIRDVLLSGGDPLLMSNNKIEYLLSELRKIKHVQFIRIGSRIPVFLPQRIDEGLCEIFKKHGPVWMSIHVNHPNECTRELAEACEKLAFSGVPIGNQSVLLKGINNNADIMRSLIHKLLMMRVRPYYLYQCDLITGSAHLRTDPREGIKIIESLRGHTTGYAIPQFVIDAPGGGGKIPINPNYIQSVTEDAIIMKNYEGKTYSYPLKPTGIVKNNLSNPELIQPMLT